jgi:transposase
MAVAYSDDLRRRVIEAASEAGCSIRAAARRFKVSASSAIKWMQRYRDTGSLSAKPAGGDRRSQRIEAHADWLLALVAAEPDLTLQEAKRRLLAEKGVAAGLGSVWRFFNRHGISFKKNPARLGARAAGRRRGARAMARRASRARSAAARLC